jgi:hypothetical protein
MYNSPEESRIKVGRNPKVVRASKKIWVIDPTGTSVTRSYTLEQDNFRYFNVLREKDFLSLEVAK